MSRGSKKRHLSPEARRIRRRNNQKIRRLVLLMFVIVVALGVASLALFKPGGEDGPDGKKVGTQKETTIVVSSAGDIILHDPFLVSSEYKTGDGYDYKSCFKFIRDYYESADFMVVNLETTLAGKEKGYAGYPAFNSPDEIASDLTECGVDLMLLANNHIYDTGKSGFLRTSQFLEDKGILHTGARNSDDDKPYFIKEIKGIKLGIINYTYETPGAGKSINANTMDSSVAGYLNSFDPENLDKFYEEFKKRLEEMRSEGAEFIIFYPHWGNEYMTKENSYQHEMSQVLCNMGVDAVIGGHPHVVQPVDMLTSEDGKHKMFCAYSMGNQLTNQRREYVPMKSGHTEDGMIVSLEITKNKEGVVSLTKVSCVPVWVEKTGKPAYYILAADEYDSLESDTGLSGVGAEAKASASRTHAIIDEGLKKVNEALHSSREGESE